MFKILGISILAFCAFSSGNGYADVKKLIVPWNPVQHPDTWGTVLDDCAKNTACLQGLDVIGAAVGVPAGTISKSLEEAKEFGVRFGGRQAGEEWRTDVFAPKGYRICDVQVRITSAAPVGVRRSPTFAATIQSNTHFELYSFVHRQGLTGGRSWVEGAATIRFAKVGSAAERKCYAVRGGVYQYRCSQHSGANCGVSRYGTMPRVR